VGRRFRRRRRYVGVSFLNNALILLRVPSFWQGTVTGRDSHAVVWSRVTRGGVAATLRRRLRTARPDTTQARRCPHDKSLGWANRALPSRYCPRCRLPCRVCSSSAASPTASRRSAYPERHGGATAPPSAAGQIEVAYITPGLADNYWVWVLYGNQRCRRETQRQGRPDRTHHDPQQQAAVRKRRSRRDEGIIISPNSSTNAPQTVLGPALLPGSPSASAPSERIPVSTPTYTSDDLQQGRDRGRVYEADPETVRATSSASVSDLTRKNAQLKLQASTRALPAWGQKSFRINRPSCTRSKRAADDA